jgi:hypothetical protein
MALQLHAFLTSVLGEGECLASRPSRFTPGERSSNTHWIGGWRRSTQPRVYYEQGIISLGVRQLELNLTIHLNVVLTLRMGKALPPLLIRLHGVVLKHRAIFTFELYI